MAWILANWSEIVAVAVAIVGAARIIVKLTPTPRDDTALASLIAALKHIGLHVE